MDGVIVGILVGIGIVVAIILTAGAAAALIGPLVAVTVSIPTVLVVAGVGGVAAGVWFDSTQLPPTLYLPMYSISPEEIISNDVLLFSVDFFNPEKTIYAKIKDSQTVEPAGTVSKTETVNIKKGTTQAQYYNITNNIVDYNNNKENEYVISYIVKTATGTMLGSGGSTVTGDNQTQIILEEDPVYRMSYIGIYVDDQSLNIKQDLVMTKTYYLRREKKISTEREPVTVTGKSAEKFNEETKGKDIAYYYYIKDGKEIKTSRQNSAFELQKVVSQWYNALRNIAIVLMMSVLLYIGIRILLTSTAADKAKYKQMLGDWFIGMCLLFFMHYIMAFSVSLVGLLTDTVRATKMEDPKYDIVGIQDKETPKLTEKLEELNMGEFVQESDGRKYIIWPTNLMGRMRLQAQFLIGTEHYIGYAICFLVLVFYTIFFTFTYIKRVIYLAFLTLIAPLVALTYPIDKITDGSAQGFNKWIKEYMFNLLIQPIHLLLYIILVTSVFEFASINIVYMLVAIGFILPAEKLLRSFFGFEKSQTAGSVAGAAIGATMISNGLNSLLGRGKGKRGSESGNGSRGEDSGSLNRISGSNSEFDELSALAGEDTGERNETARMAMEGGTEETSSDGGSQSTSINGTNLGSGLSNSGLINKTQLEAAKKGRFKRSIKNSFLGTGRAIRAGGRRVLYSGRNGARKLSQTLPKSIIKGASGLALGLTAGTIGVAAGLASSDFSNVAKFGGAGLAAGAVSGSSLAGRVMGSGSNTDTSKAMKEAYYGKEELKRREQEQEIKQWKKEVQNIEKLESKLGHEKTKQMMKSGEIDEYLRNDIIDAKEMAIMRKLQDENVVSSRKQAIAVQKYAQRTGETHRGMKQKDKKDWINTFSTELQNRGFSENVAEEKSKKTMDRIDQYYKLKNN